MENILSAALIILGVILLLAILRRSFTAKNYLNPNSPFYSGNFVIENPRPAGNLTVLSYNISYGDNLDLALAEVREIELQRTLDILLLQEMDEVGTEKLASDLKMNYVYYPATIEPKYKRNFGNAVLSRWPIIASRKLILPHISLSDRMKRVATQATIRIQVADIIAYSIHTEPVFIWPKYKEEQCYAVLEDLGCDAKCVIVGGDFNSFTEKDVQKLEKRYRQAGFMRAAKGIGNTFVRFGFQMAPDQIFAKGFDVESAGKIATAKASDHLPIWVTLILQ